MIKIGIVGCGSIGAYLTKEIVKKYRDKVEYIGISEIDVEKVIRLKHFLKREIKIYSITELMKKCDLIIEAATTETAAYVVEQALILGKDVMIMSVGGLLSKPALLKKVYSKNIKLYVPSGAIAGLDALKAAHKGKIDKVTLITKKPLDGLKDAPYIQEKKIDLKKIKKEEIIFEGSALAAVAGFPKNINVAAVLSLAGIGARKTKVCIIASRLSGKNTHTVEIEGDFGKITCCTENVPSQINPKTSKLAVLSALATLDSLLSNVKIGT